MKPWLLLLFLLLPLHAACRDTGAALPGQGARIEDLALPRLLAEQLVAGSGQHAR